MNAPTPTCIVCGDSILTHYRHRRYCTKPKCQAVRNRKGYLRERAKKR